MNPSVDNPLPRRFVLYVPTGHPTGETLCRTLEGVLCDRMGGATSYPAKGTFKMADGRRISEAIQVLEVYCELEEWAEHLPFLMATAGLVGGILEQESIACAVDGRMQFVAPAFPVSGAKFRAEDSSEECERLLADMIVDVTSRRAGE